MDQCTYSPEISSGNTLVTAMPSTIPYTLENRSTVLFQYPFDTPSTTVELRTPALNDIRVLEFSRVQRRSRGGTLVLFFDEDWPKSLTMNLSFSSLSADQRDEILSFIKLSLGKWIKFTDWRSQEHKMVLISPQTSITQEGRGCQFTWKADLQEILT